ncbi:hypothetical protein, partial [Streptococcus pseudopneumoniae]
MYAIYKGIRYSAEQFASESKITLHSKSQDEGFEAYVSKISGRVFKDYFVKKVKMEELDYLYSIHYEIQYKGHSFYVSSGMIRRNIEKDWFEIIPSVNQNQIKDELGFKQINKLEWA